MITTLDCSDLTSFQRVGIRELAAVGVKAFPAGRWLMLADGRRITSYDDLQRIRCSEMEG